MKRLFLLPLLILLVIGFILTGCAQSTPTTDTTAPATSAVTTSATPTSPAATKTITYGVITDLTGSLGLQCQAWFDTVNEMINAKGGLKIGNDYYKLNAITYSNDNDMNKAVSAVNRLVFQDKVQYMICHQGASDAILPITDPAKVICFNNAAIWNSGFLDKWHYSYSLFGQGTHEVAVAGWLAENHPEIKGPNGLAMALPDSAMGHLFASLFSYPYKVMGCQPQLVFFPADQRDQSALGTKIATTNPAWLFPNIGKVEDMALVSSACYDAGYRGHYFTFLDSDLGLLEPVLKPEVLENFISGVSAMETNPPMSQLAAEMKNAYVAKYGKWDYADYETTPGLFALMAAMQKAGTTDVEAVNNVLREGLSGINVADGNMNMITRPDMRSDGAHVDGIMDTDLKQIHNKQMEIIAHLPCDVTLGYVRKGYPPLQPGQTPTIVPPM